MKKDDAVIYTGGDGRNVSGKVLTVHEDGTLSVELADKDKTVIRRAAPNFKAKP